MNDSMLSEYEGKTVRKLHWPFYRYKLLLPKEIKKDTFQWLYLSLVRYYNLLKKKEQYSYDKDSCLLATTLIRDKFSKIINNQTLDKIVFSVENRFISKDTSGKPCMNQSALVLLDTYQDLFSDQMEIRYVFQDAVTGEIAPRFYEQAELGSIGLQDRYDGNDLIQHLRTKTPTDSSIKKAYARFIQLKKYNPEIVDIEDEEETSESKIEEEAIVDEDAPVFFEDEFNDDMGETEHYTSKQLDSLRLSRILPIDDRVRFTFIVDVEIRENRPFLISPFGNYTNYWMTSCFNKGRNQYDELSTIYNELKEKLVPEETIDRFLESPIDSILQKLPNTGELYLIVDTLGDRLLRETVRYIEEFYQRKSPLFYSQCGKLLDRLVRLIDYPEKSTAETRLDSTFEWFTKLIQIRFEGKFDYRKMLNEDIYNNWRKKYDYRYESFNFKSDLIDMLLFTDIRDIESLFYHDVINDIFDLFNLRNSDSHGNDFIRNNPVEKKYLDHLETAVRIITRIK